jgi:exodeoxyribonuclease V alpha subunit
VEWFGGQPLRNRTNPIEADVVVCDEMGMTDLKTTAMLLDAIGTGTHVVFVGDVDQLLPVGAGRPFADLLESNLVPTTRLTEIYRQKARSRLVLAAHAFNHGAYPPRADANLVQDFFMMPERGTAALADTVVELASGRLAAHYRVDSARDVQVIAPVYDSVAGVDNLNERIRDRLNPHGRPVLNGRLRIGDKLISFERDRESGVRKNETLWLLDHDTVGKRLILADDFGDQFELPHDRAGSLHLGYVVTVHRAQGTEKPVVVVACHCGGGALRLLSQELIYTAVTRARKVGVLVHEPRALAMALRRHGASHRYSHLAARLAPPEQPQPLAA